MTSSATATALPALIEELEARGFRAAQVGATGDQQKVC